MGIVAPALGLFARATSQASRTDFIRQSLFQWNRNASRRSRAAWILHQLLLSQGSRKTAHRRIRGAFIERQSANQRGAWP